MVVHPRDRLYELLPAVYRSRDAGQGEPLRALLTIIGDELARIETDIADLYDDWFIETCAEWLIPYIGDLLGVRPLHELTAVTDMSLRAYVANTLRYRRRKGTAPVLEQLARDITGWPCRVVEYFERLVTTQHLNHIRLYSPATASLRNANRLELTNSPLATLNHTAEVRRIEIGRGRYNIPNLGLHLWRLQPYVVQGVTPQPVTDPPDGRYWFSPLGNDIPLFNRPRTELEITQLANEPDLPVPLRRRALADDLTALRRGLIGDSTHLSPVRPAFQIAIPDGTGVLKPIPAAEILICDLGDWSRPPNSVSHGTQSFPIRVAVDPQRGRIAFPDGVLPDDLLVNYTYGFAADIGGGPYSRHSTLISPTPGDFTATVARRSTADVTTLAAALAAWSTSSASVGVITILDSATYAEDLTITMTPDRTLIVQAADGQRPLIRLLNPLRIVGNGDRATLNLNGLWLEGGIELSAGSLERLVIQHCTLVPGWRIDATGTPQFPNRPSIQAVAPNPDLRVELTRSISGALYLGEDADGLLAYDSIVDAFAPAMPACAAGAGGEKIGPPASFVRCTVYGEVRVRQTNLISESLMLGRVLAARRQIGCSRFSFLALGSRAPRRFRCQPDLALAAEAAARGRPLAALTAAQRQAITLSVTPSFTSTRFGHPAYMQLARTCPISIIQGAEDGNEMGAFYLIQQTYRLTNLQIALNEYLRVGLAAGVWFVT